MNQRMAVSTKGLKQCHSGQQEHNLVQIPPENAFSAFIKKSLFSDIGRKLLQMKESFCVCHAYLKRKTDLPF